MKSSANKPKNKQTSTDSFPMAGVDVEQLERLLDFMASHGLEEFEYEHAGLHIPLLVDRRVARRKIRPRRLGLRRRARYLRPAPETVPAAVPPAPPRMPRSY